MVNQTFLGKVAENSEELQKVPRFVTFHKNTLNLNHHPMKFVHVVHCFGPFLE